MKRLLFFFALMLGFVSVVFAQDGLTPETDYDAIIATFAGFAGGIVLLVEGIKKLFPKMSGIWTQLVSWLTGIVAVMLLWWLDAHFFREDLCMDLSEILNLVLGGGLATALTALITIRPTVRKANAAAETVRIDNVDKATHILIENIVEPLKKELNATRREMARLRKAIDGANDCEYRSDCPVLYELRDIQNPGSDEPVDPVRPKRGQSKKRIRGAVDGGHSGISDEAENTGC